MEVKTRKRTEVTAPSTMKGRGRMEPRGAGARGRAELRVRRRTGGECAAASARGECTVVRACGGEAAG